MSRRRSDSSVVLLMVELMNAPWPFGIILAIIAFGVLGIWVPTLDVPNPLLKVFRDAAPMFGLVLAGLFVLCSVISFFRGLGKKKLLKRQSGLESIRNLDWREFEQLLDEVFRLRGYQVEDTGSGADGGVDLILRKAGETILVQCKHWRQQKIGVKVVRELYGVVQAEGATKGIVVSSGVFTEEAKAFADKVTVELIAGQQLEHMIRDLNAGHPPARPMVSPAPTPPSPAPVDTHPACPLCGQGMVMRTARRGANAGNSFWGCPGYPKCKGTRQA